MKISVVITVKAEVTSLSDFGRSHGMLKATDVLIEAKKRLNYKAPSYTIKTTSATLTSKSLK